MRAPPIGVNKAASRVARARMLALVRDGLVVAFGAHARGARVGFVASGKSGAAINNFKSVGVNFRAAVAAADMEAEALVGKRSVRGCGRT